MVWWVPGTSRTRPLLATLILGEKGDVRRSGRHRPENRQLSLFDLR
ncbi:hypothetical protein [Intestinimonas sp.]